jgi:hypothetical protein
MPKADNPSKASSDPENLLRASLVDAAREGWTNRLIDLSRRNNLLYYKPTASTTLEFPVTQELMSFLSDSRPRPISDILGIGHEKLSSVRAIARKGLENLEEKGLSTLYLALGQCTWTATDGGRDPISPIFLIPTDLKLKGQDLEATEMQVSGEFEVNPVLLHIFNRELNLPLSAETLLDLFTSYQAEEDEGETLKTLLLKPVLDFLNGMASKLPGFKAEPFAVLGNFSFQKLTMSLRPYRGTMAQGASLAARRPLPTPLPLMLFCLKTSTPSWKRIQASNVRSSVLPQASTRSYTGRPVPARARPSPTS